jgi:glycosyltransferase involved in cell wall biosynthesis
VSPIKNSCPNNKRRNFLKMDCVFSIIIPTYNRALELRRAITSVRSQSFQNWELIVVDNDSVDTTEDVVRSFNDERIKLIKTQNNGVIAKSRNLGIKVARGEFISFLDSDDWWAKEKLANAFQCFSQGCDVVYHRCYLVNNSRPHLLRSTVGKAHKFTSVLEDFALRGNFVVNSSVSVRKALLVEVGLICEKINLVTIEDFDTWVKLAKQSNKWHFDPKPLGFYFVGSTNLSQTSAAVKSLEAFVEKHRTIFVCAERKHGWNWVNYAIGKGYFDMHDYEVSKTFFFSYLRSGVPKLVLLKSLFFFLLSMLNILKCRLVN